MKLVISGYPDPAEEGRVSRGFPGLSEGQSQGEDEADALNRPPIVWK